MKHIFPSLGIYHSSRCNGFFCHQRFIFFFLIFVSIGLLRGAFADSKRSCYDSMDLLYLQDVTCSFHPLWNSIARKSYEFVNVVREVDPSVRVGVATFGDKNLHGRVVGDRRLRFLGKSGDYCLKINLPLQVADSKKVKNVFSDMGLLKMRKGGGGDWDEAVFEAVYRTALSQRTDWRDPALREGGNIYRHILVVTDAKSHMEHDVWGILGKSVPSFHSAIDNIKHTLDENYGCTSVEYPSAKEVFAYLDKEKIFVTFLVVNSVSVENSTIVNSPQHPVSDNSVANWYKKLFQNLGVNIPVIEVDFNLQNLLDGLKTVLKEYRSMMCVNVGASDSDDLLPKSRIGLSGSKILIERKKEDKKTAWYSNSTVDTRDESDNLSTADTKPIGNDTRIYTSTPWSMYNTRFSQDILIDFFENKEMSILEKAFHFTKNTATLPIDKTIQTDTLSEGQFFSFTTFLDDKNFITSQEKDHGKRSRPETPCNTAVSNHTIVCQKSGLDQDTKEKKDRLCTSTSAISNSTFDTNKSTTNVQACITSQNSCGRESCVSHTHGSVSNLTAVCEITESSTNYSQIEKCQPYSFPVNNSVLSKTNSSFCRMSNSRIRGVTDKKNITMTPAPFSDKNFTQARSKYPHKPNGSFQNTSVETSGNECLIGQSNKARKIETQSKQFQLVDVPSFTEKELDLNKFMLTHHGSIYGSKQNVTSEISPPLYTGIMTKPDQYGHMNASRSGMNRENGSEKHEQEKYSRNKSRIATVDSTLLVSSDEDVVSNSPKIPKWTDYLLGSMLLTSSTVDTEKDRASDIIDSPNSLPKNPNTSPSLYLSEDGLVDAASKKNLALHEKNYKNRTSIVTKLESETISNRCSSEVSEGLIDSRNADEFLNSNLSNGCDTGRDNVYITSNQTASSKEVFSTLKDNITAQPPKKERDLARGGIQNIYEELYSTIFHEKKNKASLPFNVSNGQHDDGLPQRENKTHFFDNTSIAATSNIADKVNVLTTETVYTSKLGSESSGFEESFLKLPQGVHGFIKNDSSTRLKPSRSESGVTHFSETNQLNTTRQVDMGTVHPGYFICNVQGINGSVPLLKCLTLATPDEKKNLASERPPVNGNDHLAEVKHNNLSNVFAINNVFPSFHVEVIQKKYIYQYVNTATQPSYCSSESSHPNEFSEPTEKKCDQRMADHHDSVPKKAFLGKKEDDLSHGNQGIQFLQSYMGCPAVLRYPKLLYNKNIDVIDIMQNKTADEWTLLLPYLLRHPGILPTLFDIRKNESIFSTQAYYQVLTCPNIALTSTCSLPYEVLSIENGEQAFPTKAIMTDTQLGNNSSFLNHLASVFTVSTLPQVHVSIHPSILVPKTPCSRDEVQEKTNHSSTSEQLHPLSAFQERKNQEDVLFYQKKHP